MAATPLWASDISDAQDALSSQPHTPAPTVQYFSEVSEVEVGGWSDSDEREADYAAYYGMLALYQRDPLIEKLLEGQGEMRNMIAVLRLSVFCVSLVLAESARTA